ncbi:tripartite tricarboxylate transporter substrate binding protein [Amphritea sp.]|uniref:tripartite tricarboxylate transporter substrate binding protein n=1 Tax=Amphritea sp. TaxID=1872502 RepID=UPI0025C33CC1|nr:tripartite tricarboxylate transporter substrate binding protein [Amphritea sp.]
MNKTIKQTIHCLAATAIGLLATIGPVQAASEYPNRPVKFLVPWPAGDVEDLLTRLIAETMAKETGKPATVVNKPGAGGVVGASEVASARADGLLIGSFVVDLVTTQIHGGNAPYDRDTFEPVGIFLDYPMTMAVRSDAPYNTMAELATYSQTNKVSLGHFGYQALPTALAFAAGEKAGIKFSSDAPFDALDCSTLANGDADVITANTISVVSCLQSGEAKLLSSMTRDRLTLTPDVPTLAEETGITLTAWNGLFVKKGTSESIKQRISEIAQKALASDRALEIAKTTGAGVYWIDIKDAEKVIESDFEATGKLLKFLKES